VPQTRRFSLLPRTGRGAGGLKKAAEPAKHRKKKHVEKSKTKIPQDDTVTLRVNLDLLDDGVTKWKYHCHMCFKKKDKGGREEQERSGHRCRRPINERSKYIRRVTFGGEPTEKSGEIQKEPSKLGKTKRDGGTGTTLGGFRERTAQRRTDETRRSWVKGLKLSVEKARTGFFHHIQNPKREKKPGETKKGSGNRPPKPINANNQKAKTEKIANLSIIKKSFKLLKGTP